MKHKLLFVVSLNLIITYNVYAQWDSVYTFPTWPDWIASSGDNLYACTVTRGVYISTDAGITFNQSNTGLSDTSTRCMITRDSLLLLGTRTGVFRSVNYGETWERSGAGIPVNVQSNVGEMIFRGDSILVATWGNGIYLSLDFGLSWNTINNGIEDLYLDCIFATNSRILAGSPTGGGIIGSDDNGLSWIDRNDGVPKMWADTSKYVIITSFARIENTIFASTRGSGLLRSDNGGKSWIVIPTPNYYIWRTLVSDYSLLTAHDGTGVLKTENFGENWIDMSDGLDLYTGEAAVRSFCNFQDYIFIGTFANKLFRRPASELFTGTIELPVQKNCIVYPNPTSGKITILLPLDNFEPAYYDMFNSLGNNIIENMLICEPEQSVELSGFSKGIYFYRIHKKGKVLFSGKVLLH